MIIIMRFYCSYLTMVIIGHGCYIIYYRSLILFDALLLLFVHAQTLVVVMYYILKVLTT